MIRARPLAGSLLALGVLEALALAAMGWIPGGRATPFPALGLWTAAFLAYAIAGLDRARPLPDRRAVWGIGIGMRALLLPLEPHFSEDAYRYLWDGWVQVAGINPYLHAPADPELAGLRTAWHGLVNHPEISTIYPPGAQAVFFFLAAAGPSLLGLKLAWTACDLGTAWLIDRLAHSRPDPEAEEPNGTTPDGARREGRPPAGPGRRRTSRALLLYLWCPLLVVEVAWSAHLEPLGLLPMMAACLVLAAGRDRTAATGISAGLLLGLGAGVKLAPAAGIPALFRRRGIAAAAVAVGVLPLLSLPYLGAGEGLVRGLGVWADRWEFNPGLWWPLSELVGAEPARVLAALAVATVALVAAARRWSVRRALFWTIGTGLLLSPTLHPWYVLWVLPFAALRGSAAWLVFSGTVFLAYWGRSAYLETGLWPHPGWLALLIHLPLLVLLAAEVARTRRWWPRSRPRRDP